MSEDQIVDLTGTMTPTGRDDPDQATDADEAVRLAGKTFQARMEAGRATERAHVQAAQDRFQVRMGVERAKERVQVQ